MTRIGCLWGAVFCLSCLWALSAEAQVSAGLSGRVTDQTGAAIAGAAVTATNLDTGLMRTAVTNQLGRYELVALPIGQYEVRAKKDGFAERVRSGILLVVGQDATVDLSLQVGNVSEQVKVVADAPIVNATTQDISGLVGEKEVKDLPLNGRSYDLLLTLNPGIVNFTWEKTGGIGVSNSTTGNNFAVSGNRPQQNLFLLNGVEFTGAAENNMQPGGPSQKLLGVEAVREFNVLRDSYGAEYGKRPGRAGDHRYAIGNAISGTARVYEFLRNNALDAPNYFDQGSAPPFQRNQFGAAVGGPIQKDKTFVFANLRGLPPEPASDLGRVCARLWPRARARCASVQPLLNLWPTPTAERLRDFNGIAQVSSSPLQTIREDFGTARLDHIFSAKDTFSAVYTIDDGARLHGDHARSLQHRHTDSARAGGQRWRRRTSFRRRC